MTKLPNYRLAAFGVATTAICLLTAAGLVLMAPGTELTRAAEPTKSDKPTPAENSAARKSGPAQNGSAQNGSAQNGSAQNGSAQNGSALTPDLVGFRKSVTPLVTAHCARCHGPTKKEGELSLTDLAGDLVTGRNLDTWTLIGQRLKAGDMPPPGEPQPSPEAVKAATDWIDAELARAGKSGVVPVGSLKTGNHIPHELLFGPKAVTTAALDAPARAWRLSPDIYGEFVRSINKNLKVSQPFTLPAGEGFRDVAGTLGIDESTAAQLIRNADAIVTEQLGLYTRPVGKPKGKSKDAKAEEKDETPAAPPALVGPKIKEFQPLFDAKTAAERSAVEAAIRREFDIVLRRAPTKEESAALAELYDRSVKTGGPHIAAKTTLMAVLLSPEAVFRLERGVGSPDSAGQRMLAPREIAFAVAYALTDRAPDSALLAAADGGRLRSPDDVAREVRRLLDDPKAEKTRIMRFFREYFGYGGAVNVFKNDKDFPAHDARGLVEDTDRLVADIVAEDRDVLRQLLTTTRSYIAHKKADQAKKQIETDLAKYAEAKKKDAKKGPPKIENKQHFRSYNAEDFPPAAQQPVSLPTDQRAGVLTQPAWLVAYSGNFDNDAIKRGKWIRTRLLGGVIPDIPIGVDAQLPDDPHKTLRQRMEVTRQDYCWQCHRKMNPIGLAFESYDHFGRHRTTELDKPVDATAAIDGTGDPKLDGSVKNAVELMRRLADSDRVRQVFVRHAFRYWMGRDENLGDARALQAADAAFVKSNGSMKALIVSLLTSESFLYRTN